MTVFKRGLAWLAALVLAACATPSPIVAPGGDADDALSRTGRFSVRVDEVQGDQHAVQGGFAWYDTGRRLVLDLNSPLGAALARVEVAADGSARLVEANGRETHAATADELVAQVLGSPIPVAGLRHWLRGDFGDQPLDVIEHDDTGRPQVFFQGGWRVTINASDPIGPTRMQLQRTEPGVRHIDARLVMTGVAAP